MKIVISSNPDRLEAALIGRVSVTVEAEYGTRFVAGSIGTLAHHGTRSGNPCPCLQENWDGNFKGICGISHFDLDTLGGVLALQGRKPDDPEFWAVAAFVDINGPHRIEECPDLNPTVYAKLRAFWAWSEANRCFAPRSGEAEDVTAFFDKAEEVLELIFAWDTDLIQAGAMWAQGLEILNQGSYHNFRVNHGIKVVVRMANRFVNAMYRTPGGEVADAVIGYNIETGSITLSFEKSGIGNACEIMQAAFGPEAGGHAGIAGSPRGHRYEFEDDIPRVFEALAKSR